MKAVILAGGLGTRLSEETATRPKPMVEIGGHPILWNVCKIYAAAGIKDFIICLGYKGYVIKEYFLNYPTHMSNVTVDLRTKEIQVHENNAEDWRVTMIDTGEKTLTGGRIKRILPYLDKEDVFCATYGDGVANIDIQKVIDFHRSHGKTATLTAVSPLGRFGHLQLSGHSVTAFEEKNEGKTGLINGGFFVLNKNIGDYIEGDDDMFEREPMERLVADGQLMAYKHAGFWRPMDTLRDKNALEEMWASGKAPWKIW